MDASPSKMPSLPRGRPPSRSAEQAGSSTVVAGLMLLRTVAQMEEPATLSAIARRSGMSMGRVFRYLKSLTHAGFLRQDRSTGQYELGLAALELSLSATARLDPVRLACDHVRELTDRIGLVSLLCVWGSNGPTVIKSEQGRLEAFVRIREGTNLSLLRTAVGRVFLSYMQPCELESLLARDIAEWRAMPQAPPDPIEAFVDGVRREVRRAGLSCVIGLRNPSVATLAAPILGAGGRLALCLAVTGIIGTFPTDFWSPPALELKATADRLSRSLGGVPHSGE